MQPTFFAMPAEFRAWLQAHHETEQEFWVGFHKKGTGKPSMTWPESVDEALCFGWIDGLRKSVDATSYMNRFTPRKSRSAWSEVNIGRVAELTSLGRMQPAGLAAFAVRTADKSGIYSYEQRHIAELGAYEQQFRLNEKAWAYFQSRSASYRQTATWWVISAKKEETRLKRLAQLITDSERGQSIGPLSRTAVAEAASE
ncbi:MAG: YdeI/OmpD-associated family protein [Chloroflexi bacterium]|nr:YdeI/OmpD-associated family protein [Chloroflexota bacterium]